MKYLLIILLLLYSPPAIAQGMCAPREYILEKLKKQYKEARIGIGLTATGQVLELLISAEGTYSIIVTSPNGRTCIIGSGEDWVTETPELEDEL